MGRNRADEVGKTSAVDLLPNKIYANSPENPVIDSWIRGYAFAQARSHLQIQSF